MTRVLAWDIGGANVKAAVADAESARARTRPFALWRERDALPAVLREMADALGNADEMALTMTAELADCFASKAEGIAFVLDAVCTTFPRARLHILDTSGRFRSPRDALEEPAAVASANWAATAHWLAREEKDALLIDVGTTTTDVIPIVAGAVAAEGRTDPDRLASGELVYTGAVRTPCAALARSLRVGGTRYRVVAERFAQSGDAHLWLGELGERDYLGDTPDGRGKTRADAGARLARMIAAEASALGDDAVSEIAAAFAERQVRLVTSAIRQVRRRLGARAPDRAVVVGLGAFLGRAAAERAGLDARDWAEEVGAEASRAAPAFALARLLWAELAVRDATRASAQSGRRV